MDKRNFAALLAFVLSITVAVSPSQAAETFRDCADCPEMVNVPAGSFLMPLKREEVGQSDKRSENTEDGRNPVSVKPFSLAVVEVTRDQFEAFVRATGYEAGGPCWVDDAPTKKTIESPAHNWRDPGFPQSGIHPAVCVNWNDARAYARWLSQKTGKNYRLPTEAEWEFAARAGTTTSLYWGDSSSNAACLNANISDQIRAAWRPLRNTAPGERNFFQCTDGHIFTAPVGKFQANGFGLHDMIGNVAEWTEDCHADTLARMNDPARLTGDCAYRNLHVIGGGSWTLPPWYVRAGLRAWSPSSNRSNDIGFRVAIGAAHSQPPPQTIVDERVAIMNSFSDTLAAFAEAEQNIETLAAVRAKLRAAPVGVKRLFELFPRGTARGDRGITKSRALPSIFDNRAEFDRWLDELSREFARVDRAFAFNEKTSESIVELERKACKSCHDKYRAPAK